jgi:hypothetical protein
MIKIEEINVPTKGIGKYFQLTSLGNKINPNKPTSVTFFWEVYTEETIVDGETTETGPGVCILVGNITMSAEIYNEWGLDDNFCLDWALNEVGLTKETI